MKKKQIILSILFCLTTLFSSCHKSSGAICRDGTRSYSTGRGTCSWHGGVRYYVDTDEISIPKTAGLILLLSGIGGAIFILNDDKKSK